MWSKSSLGSAPARLLCLLTGLPASPLAAQTRPRVLERAASNAAHFLASNLQAWLYPKRMVAWLTARWPHQANASLLNL